MFRAYLLRMRERTSASFGLKNMILFILVPVAEKISLNWSTCFIPDPVLRHNKLFFPALITILIIIVLSAIAFGTVPIRLSDMSSEINNLLAGQKPGNIREAVFVQLRLPRVVLCSITGAILA